MYYVLTKEGKINHIFSGLSNGSSFCIAKPENIFWYLRDSDTHITETIVPENIHVCTFRNIYFHLCTKCF